MKTKFRVSFDSKKHQQKVVSGAEKALYRTMIMVETLAKRRAPVDTGRLKNSINLTPKREGAKAYTVSDGVAYGVFLEFGTTPHFPPPDSLSGWTRRTLGRDASPFAIAQAIAKRGTPAQPFLRPAAKEAFKVHLPRYWNRYVRSSDDLA